MKNFDQEKVEKFLQENIFPELERGRPGWDKPHTENVVKHLKGIVKNSLELDLDFPVLLISAYAHDWGYADLFGTSNDLNMSQIISRKIAHMKIGAKKIEVLLENKIFDFLTNVQKARIVYLVSVHDYYLELKNDDELVLMEADSIGAMDLSGSVSRLPKKDNDRWMKNSKEKRFPKFITDYGKKKYLELFEERKEIYENL